MISMLVLALSFCNQGVIDQADVIAHNRLRVRERATSRYVDLNIPQWAKIERVVLRSHSGHMDIDVMMARSLPENLSASLKIEVLLSDEKEVRHVKAGCLMQLAGKSNIPRLQTRLTPGTIATWDQASRLQFLEYEYSGNRITAHLPASMNRTLLYSIESAWTPDKKKWVPPPEVYGSGSSWERKTGALMRAAVSFENIAKDDIVRIR